MSTTSAAPVLPPSHSSGDKFVLKIVGGVAVAHMLNDLIQAVLPSIYPLLKVKYGLAFAQIGWIGMIYQLTASLLQPCLGFYSDKHPKPYLLPVGMMFTLLGIGLVASSQSYPMLLVSAAVIGIGSATFHPEASRVARLASGGRFGTAQSAFQVGGNTGSALGPLVASAVVLPYGQGAFGWLAIVGVTAIWVLFGVSRWRIHHLQTQPATSGSGAGSPFHTATIVRALAVVFMLLFAKFIYIAAFTNYFSFYLIERFKLTAEQSQFYLFCFLAAVAAGTFIGGPVGDRIGRRAVIWTSFLGVAPFALLLPHANLFWTAILAITIGVILSSAFAALVVYAQEMVPGRVGMVSGIMFGLSFGIGGIGAAGLGNLADVYGIVRVYNACAYLPLLGFATAFLPHAPEPKAGAAAQG